MIGNVHYWHGIYTSSFAGEVEALRGAVLDRLLPTFEGVEAEADAVTHAEYERLGQRWNWDEPDVDMSDAAALAYEAGLEFYERMTGVRQGLINLAAAGLYHLYEQQVTWFVQRVLVTLHEDTIQPSWRSCSSPGRQQGDDRPAPDP